MGVGQSGLAGSESEEYVIEENAEHREVDQRVDHYKHQRVAEHELRPAPVGRAEHYGYSCRGSRAYEHAYGRRYVHHRKRDGQPGYRFGAHPLAYEYAVDDIIQRHHHHAHHRRQAVVPQQTGDAPCGEPVEIAFQRRLTFHCTGKITEKWRNVWRLAEKLLTLHSDLRASAQKAPENDAPGADMRAWRLLRKSNRFK